MPPPHSTSRIHPHRGRKQPHRTISTDGAMGDIAQILKGTQASSDAPSGAGSAPSKAMKMSGVSKDVMNMLCGTQDTTSAALPPIVPSFVKDSQDKSNPGEDMSIKEEVNVKVGNKWISSKKPARQWTWAPFSSSSRTDGAMFRHWVRANVEYTDYPYAKFDIHLDPVAYTDEEAARYLASDSWTRSETDKLMELARRYELRWAVIHDRWLDYYYSQEDGENQVMRKVEDLQERYYNVAAILSQLKIRQEATAESHALSSVSPDPNTPDAEEKNGQLLLETAAARSLATVELNSQPLITHLGTGTMNKLFDSSYERERRAHLDRLWRRSKEHENEEIQLRKELRGIEAQLRKLKKSGGHILAAASGNGRFSSASSSRNPSRAVSPAPGTAIVDNPEVLHHIFASTAPVPMPQNPYLQSGRLVPPGAGGGAGLNKTMLTRLQQVLTELKIPARPLPTKAVCDLYDDVRKDILTLLTLQKMTLQKEGNLQTKRVKLAKLSGTTSKVMDEEALLGIAPAPVAPAHGTTTAKKSSKQTKTKSTSTKTKPTGETPDGSKKPKPSAKRKRKADAPAKAGKEPMKTAPAPDATLGVKSPKIAVSPTPVPQNAMPPTSTTPPPPVVPTTAPLTATNPPEKIPTVADTTTSSGGKKRARKA